MSNYLPFKETHIEPNAEERIQKKLKDISQIEKERPCYKCAFYSSSRMIRCGLAHGRCDFHHSAFVPIGSPVRTRRNKKWEETD